MIAMCAGGIVLQEQIMQAIYLPLYNIYMYLRDKSSGLCSGTECRAHILRYAVIIDDTNLPTPIPQVSSSFITQTRIPAQTRALKLTG